MVVAVALAVLLVGLAAPGVLGQETATPTNETVRHEDPETVEEAGDLGELSAWLDGRLSERLRGSTVSIDEGTYAEARSLLGDEYDDQLARYVDVAGETATEEDDAAAEAFRTAGNRTRALANQTEAFAETAEAYREARASGNQTRARTLARRLIQRAREIDRTAADVSAAYATAGNLTGRDFDRSIEQVDGVRRNATEQADAVAAATFVRTRLSARASAPSVSFRSPTTVRGQLVDENGTALANRTVLVGATGDAVAAETNASGWYSATYRPVRLRVDGPGVPVRFVPPGASGYLGNRTYASASVSAVTPSVSLSVGPQAAAFGDWVLVRGSVTADGTPVGGAPLAVAVDGVVLERVVTGGDGGYVATGRLPATVPAGEREVAVRVDQTGRAVARASGTATIDVEPTGTTLTLDARRAGGGTVELSGRLLTADGRGLANQSVGLSVAGATVETVETLPNGRFVATVDVSDVEGDDATATATFDGAGTSLEGASASAAFPVPGASGSGDWLGAWAWLAVAALVVGGGAALGWWVVRDGGGPAPADGGDGGTGSEAAASSVETPAFDDAWRGDVEALLAAGETDRAVATAYGTLRRRLAAELDLSGALTHWEVYAACADDGLAPDRVAAIRAVTEAYERARYAPGALTPSEAGEAVECLDDAL